MVNDVRMIALATDIDQLQLELSDAFQLAVKVIVAVFLFGIALDTRVADFRDVVRRPFVIGAGAGAFVGLLPQDTPVSLAAVVAAASHP